MKQFKLTILISTYFATIFLWTDLSFWIAGTLALIVFFGATLMNLFVAIRLRSKELTFFAISIILLYVLGAISGEFINYTKKEKSLVLAESIITEIDSFYQNHGYYPESLEQIGMQQNTLLGVFVDIPYIYYRKSTGFSLQYSSPMWTKHIYSLEGWQKNIFFSDTIGWRVED